MRYLNNFDLKQFELYLSVPGDILVESTAPVATCIVDKWDPSLPSSTINLPSVVPMTRILPSAL